MASRSVQLVPAGARQIAPGVFQQVRRRGHGGRGRKHHGHAGHRRTVSEFRKPYVMNAIAANVGVGLINAWGLQLPHWVDPRALALYVYGTWRNNRSAIAAAKTMQATFIGTYKGIPNIVANGVRSMQNGGGSPGAHPSGGGSFFGSLGSTFEGITAPITSALGPAAGSAIGSAVAAGIAAAL